MEETKKGGITAAPGWSWGAFLFGAPFLIAIKKYHMLWWYLLYLVPVVNFFFWIVFMIYLGIKGHEMAATSRHFENQHEYNGFIKAVDHAGKILTIVAIVIIAAGLIFGFTALIGSVFHIFSHY